MDISTVFASSVCGHKACVKNTVSTVITLLLSMSVLWPSLLQADEYQVNIHLASHHFIERDDGGDWNEKNYGLGLQKRVGAYAIEGGVFKNSYDDTSLYATVNKVIGYRAVIVSGFAGMASGYPDEVSTLRGLRFIGGIGMTYRHIRVTATHKFISVSLSF